MKRIIFLVCLLAALYCLGCGIYVFCTVGDLSGKLYLGVLCLFATVAYGYFAYENYKKLMNPWA